MATMMAMRKSSTAKRKKQQTYIVTVSEEVRQAARNRLRELHPSDCIDEMELIIHMMYGQDAVLYLRAILQLAKTQKQQQQHDGIIVDTYREWMQTWGTVSGDNICSQAKQWLTHIDANELKAARVANARDRGRLRLTNYLSSLSHVVPALEEELFRASHDDMHCYEQILQQLCNLSLTFFQNLNEHPTQTNLASIVDTAMAATFTSTASNLHSTNHNSTTMMMSTMMDQVFGEQTGEEKRLTEENKKCRKCGQLTVTYALVQDRSRDEGQTIEFRCLACQAKWKKRA